jgi:hypothetical protein
MHPPDVSLRVLRGTSASEEVPVDEHTNTGPEDSQVDDEQQRDERFDRVLTQRELVRASLLRCPPEDQSEPRRH